MLWRSVKARARSTCIHDRLRREPHARRAREDEGRDVGERVEAHRRDADDVGHVAEDEGDRRAARERVLVHPHEEDERQDERRDGPAHVGVADATSSA